MTKLCEQCLPAEKYIYSIYFQYIFPVYLERCSSTGIVTNSSKNMGCGTTRNPYSIRLCFISGGQWIIICIFLVSIPRNYLWEVQLLHQYGWIRSSHHLSHPPAVFVQLRHGASHLRLCNIINFSCFQKAIKNPHKQTKTLKSLLGMRFL